MNISKIMLVGSFIGFGLTSCMNEEFPSSETRQGTMSLAVDKLTPTATRAVETADYPVSIWSIDNNEEFASYEKASLVPAKITMPVGNYYAEAHTPGVLEKIMNAPYYSGREDFEVIQQINTYATVTCRMANGSITVRFSDDFTTAFSAWTVSVDDGSTSAIVYSNEDGLTPDPLYIKYEENVDVLNVNFVGTTTKGSRISTSNKLTKKAASEKYDNDNPYFSGGDAIVIVFKPVESTEGDITGIELNADIKFEESEESFDMEVTDNVQAGGEQPGGGEEPGGDSGAIILNLPKNMVVSGSTDPSLGDTYINAVNGIKSIKVKVSSTSEEMISSLNDLAGNYDGIDFINGTEVVGNQGLVGLFTDLGQTLEVPAEGDKEYTFPIGNFFGLLQFLDGQHTFELIITDMDGNKKSGKLLLVVGGELPEGEEEETPGNTDSNITLNLPSDMTVSGATDPALGNTYISAESGIKSIKVKISSTSDEMISSLDDLAGNYTGIDFTNGTEVVGNQGLVGLFTDLGQTLEVPAEGDKEYTFPIGNFFGLLQFLAGEHTFELIVTDLNGNNKSGSLKLTVE